MLNSMASVTLRHGNEKVSIQECLFQRIRMAKVLYSNMLDNLIAYVWSKL